MQSFKLTTEQLLNIASEFEKRVKEGLGAWNQQIRCMPTWISMEKTPKSGRAVVLDLGGTNLRAGIVSVENGECRVVDRFRKISMPWQRNTPFDRESYLKIQVDALAALEWKEPLPLGYCFSHPAEPTPDRDVVLVKWAKGIDVPGTLGQKMGQMLLSYMANRYPELKCSGITVINDTVASLIAGMADPAETTTIGLIAGTGNNMAVNLNPNDMPKIAGESHIARLLPVNLESGNFSPPHLTEWDAEVDRSSNNPGEQLLEKAVSGAYLGSLFKALLPNSGFDENKGGAELAEILDKPENYPGDWYDTAELIYLRSADLVAAVLAGLIGLLNRQYGNPRVRIVAEGALFWGKTDGYLRYRDRVDKTLAKLLGAMKIHHLQLEFYKKADTNLIGAALAALSY